jgi:CheY-like chemotaxis protein
MTTAAELSSHCIWWRVTHRTSFADLLSHAVADVLRSARPNPRPDATPPSRADAEPAARPPKPPFADRRILVVDDEPDVLRVVAKRLERVGCEVGVAVDGEEALTLLLSDGPPWDLVLTDQTMPRRTGEQLLLAMREAGVTTPVVVMSGYSATVTPERMLAIGAAAFLPKPFDGTQLLATVAAVIGR